MTGDPEDDDAALIQRASRGDASAFGTLVQRYESGLFNFLYRYVGQRDTARDLCQEAFLRAFRGLPGFRVGSPFKPWLYRVAVNVAHSHGRRGSRREVGMDSPPEPPESVGGTGVGAPPAADSSLSRAQDSAAVQRALARLPEEYREVLVLRFVEDFSYEQIADVLGGVGVSALKMRVHRGLARLRELMQESP